MSFQLTCLNCDNVGVVIDHPEIAPPSSVVRCSHCNSERGTLGELRRLAVSGRRDLHDARVVAGA